MEFLQRILVFSLLLLPLSSIPSRSYSLFSPIDNYLINCGSAVDSTIDNRNFVSDCSRSSSRLSSSTRSVSLRNKHPLAGLPLIYNSARVFKASAKYEFEIREKGTHMVRIHFQSFNSSKVDLIHAQFHVLINGYVASSNFSGRYAVNRRVKEYLIWVDSEKLVIDFVPVKKSNFAFVNAIEVISAPKDLVADTAKYLCFEKNEDFDGLAKNALEVVYRVNVGGPKVTPFNDTLWRTWVPDDKYYKSSSGSQSVYTSGRINYQSGGVSREVCPDNVYNTARVIKSTNASIPNVNMTWIFPVMGEYRYMVRLHFCDIASISIGLLYFNVYVNGYLAYENLDLSYMVNWALASPFYADFIVNGDTNSGVLSVSVGPSNGSISYGVDGILNGIEIMKTNNSVGSFDGILDASVLSTRARGNISVLLPLVMVVFLVVSISMVLRRRMMKESVGWSRLPVDVFDVNLKNGN